MKLQNSVQSEVWKPIEGYEGLYEISRDGVIRSLPRLHTKGKVIKTSLGSSGYEQVHLSKDSVVKTFMVHRLVAKTFIDNPENYPEVNHKDEDKRNNSIDNLEWCDRNYNQNYGTAIRRMRDSHNYSESNKKGAEHHDYDSIGKKRRKALLQIDDHGNVIKRWDGFITMAKETGYSKGNVAIACDNGNKAYGYYWKREEDV